MTDNYKKVEAMLYNYQENKAYAKKLKIDLEELKREGFEGISAIGQEERTGPTYKITSSVENEVIRREKEIELLEKKIRSLEVDVEKVDNILPVLSDMELKLVTMKYFKKMKHRDIAKELGYVEAYITQKRSKIIDRLKELIWYY